MQRKVRMSRKNTVKHNYRKGVFVISIVLLILCAALFVKYHSLSKQAQANEEEIASFLLQLRYVHTFIYEV